LCNGIALRGNTGDDLMSGYHDSDVLAQALAEPTRRAILENLRLGEKTVTELVQATQRKQPNLSNHLARMRSQGLVRAERVGRKIYYSLATPFAETLLRFHETASSALMSAGQERQTPLTDDAGTNAASLADWQETCFQNLLDPQEEPLVMLVNGLLARRLDLETIYGDIFQPALYRIGDIYMQGSITEAQEHLASARIERMMSRVAQFYAPVARAERRAVLGCVAGNWHVLGLRMLADGLRRARWETLFLGANVPTESFVTMVASARPDLVVLSCSLAEHLSEMARLITLLREASEESPFQIAVGGYYLMAHPEALADLNADFSAPDLSHFLHEVRSRFPAHLEG
jgi:MerR family transcriptional regulator, light-induced transcriptional regulator